MYNTMQVIRVHGEPGARAFVMPPMSSVLLLDETAPIVWLKHTDGAGYPELKAYKIEPIEPEPTDTAALMERIRRLEEKLNEQSNVAASSESEPGHNDGAVNAY